jgi:Ca2+-binding RTX toxin-like protein
MAALVWSFASVAAASGSRGTRGGSAEFLSDGAFVGYFVGLNGTKAKEDDDSDDTFPAFNRNLASGPLTGDEGSAKATSKLTATVDDIDAGLRNVTANGSVSGSSRRNGSTHAPGIPSASADSFFSFSFGVNGPTPVTIRVSLSASNDDNAECTEVTADLEMDGQETIATKHAGGDCDPASGPSSISFSGTVTEGGDLGVDLSGEVATERKGASNTFLGSFSVNASGNFGRCTITGTPDGERLVGTDDPDVICGMGGLDRMDGFDGDDVFVGGDTVDTIRGGIGDDTILGGGGADDIQGGPDGDTIHGGDGIDQIQGGPGEDDIFGEEGCDQVDGGPDGDGIRGGDEAVTPGFCDKLDGGDGDDQIFGEKGTNLILGGDGDDTLVGGPDSDILLDSHGPTTKMDGGAGRDGICGSPQADVIKGGDGDDILTGNRGQDTISGGIGDDDVSGGVGEFASHGQNLCPADLSAPDLRDLLDGGPGDDQIHGGDGLDSLKGGAGSDKLEGDEGEDTLIGGPRKDVLNGGTENDVINACDGGLDTVIGGAGPLDRARVDRGIDAVHADVEVRTAC